MRVLSLKQPWATLIVRGVKRYEARSWQTPYRGRIAIHASTGTEPGVFDLVDQNDAMASVISGQGWSDASDLKSLPRMAVVGAVDIVRIVPAKQIWAKLASEDKVLLTSDEELPDGFFVWELASPVESKPVSVKGKLNLWTLPDAVAKSVEDGLRRPPTVKTISAKAIDRAKRARSERVKAAEELMATPISYTAALAAIVGKPPRSRVEIMKKVWRYIKANKLQDPDDPAIILVQKLMKGIIPKKTRVTMFEMTEYLFAQMGDE